MFPTINSPLLRFLPVIYPLCPSHSFLVTDSLPTNPLTTGAVDGVSAGDPAVGIHSLGRSLPLAVDTLDSVADVLCGGDESARQEAEGGGPAVVEAKDCAINVGV